jgi:hypothetical protein
MFVIEKPWVPVESKHAQRMSVERRPKGRAMSDRPVVVNTRESSAGALVAGIVAVLLIALAVWYFGFRGADSDGGGTGVTVEVEVPTTAAP